MEGGHREKIHRDHLPEVVAQEGGPGLAAGTTWLAHHIFANGSLGHANPQLEQFAMDTRSAPEGVGSGHLPNEIDGRGSHALAPGFRSPALPAPEQAKALPMPAYHRVWLDQSQDTSPLAPRPRKPDPEDTIRRFPSRSLGVPAQDQELVPQRRVLQDQIPAGLEVGDGQTKRKTQPATHPPRVSTKPVRNRDFSGRMELLPTTPHHYLAEMRLARARDLLAQTTLSTKDVALRVGFEDPQYFCRLFHQKVGLPPGLWRKRRH